MTATTFTRLPLLAGTAVATSLGRAGLWTMSRYMRAPLASTGMLALVTLTALAASNALYFQTARHPAPFFAPAMDVPVAEPAAAPEPMPAPVRETAVVTTPVTQETTGSVAAPAPVIPAAPVGNSDAFAVQKKLTELGLFNGTVDGFYGPMTANAIRAFEERNGMTPTGAMTRDVIDAILRADTAGLVPVAQPAPAVQQAVVVQPAPQVTQPQPVAQPDRVVARLPDLSPVDQAVDTIGNAAAQTIDSIVAAVDGGRTPPAAPAVKPIPALPLVAAPQAQQMPAPVQVASLEPMAPPAAVAPANNVQLVSQIQTGLASLGFYHGSIDGHPGDATAKAIREFENFHSYRVTGQVNPDLVGLLRQAGAAI
ncbi:peptidoglycan-binding protein [Devosia ginsengisoli]|uniref:peptidoglycan-binding domain-containing protein n=1 Tax=Devosia ginsengisoli TaxID=400770 RepID=UPI0026F02658|nr:peptidoglycan-binding protein [Devosia ginsengisoli]MCR6673355.1 peptidoglycan-binding protein [Devosia ginsengisoli]